MSFLEKGGVFACYWLAIGLLLADVVDDGVQSIEIGRARGPWLREELIALANARHADRRRIAWKSAHRQRRLAWRREEGRGLVRMFIRASGSETEQPNSNGEFATHTDSDREEIEVKGGGGQYCPGRQAQYRLGRR